MSNAKCTVSTNMLIQITCLLKIINTIFKVHWHCNKHGDHTVQSAKKKHDLMGKLYTLFILHYMSSVMLTVTEKRYFWQHLRRSYFDLLIYLRIYLWIYIVHHSHTCVCVWVCVRVCVFHV